jgi:hypothetical protein
MARAPARSAVREQALAMPKEITTPCPPQRVESASGCVPKQLAESRLGTDKQPGTNSEQRVKNRERDQQMREHPGYRQGHEHCRYQHQSVNHGSGDELSRPRTTAEQVEPANDRNGHAHHTDERFLVPDESSIHENRLSYARLSKEERSGPQVDDPIDRRVLGSSGQGGRLIEKILGE